MLRVVLPVTLLALAACADVKKSYESDPVTIQTESGPVTCQLYTPDMVMWDRAISKPNGMGDADANRHCRAEGELRKGVVEDKWEKQNAAL